MASKRRRAVKEEVVAEKRRIGTYTYRNVERRRAYMRTLMQERRAKGKR